MSTWNALEILAHWDPAMPREHAAQLIASRLHGPIDGETATALFESFNRMALELAVVMLMLEGKLVARANVDPARSGRWVYRTAEADTNDQADLPAHDEVKPGECGPVTKDSGSYVMAGARASRPHRAVRRPPTSGRAGEPKRRLNRCPCRTRTAGAAAGRPRTASQEGLQ